MEHATVLIIGSGAREHAISLAYEKSPEVKKIILSPGNDFMKHDRKKEVITDVNGSLRDATTVLALAKKYNPDLIDVAQDNALAEGTVDVLQHNGFRAFGPTQKAARLEWDKNWSREFMLRHKIPSPKFMHFFRPDEGKKYAEGIYAFDRNAFYYVKANGLCAGKGALPAHSLPEAQANIDKMFTFGEAGLVFLIEEGLVGEEYSYYAISDGKNYKTFKSSQDHKRLNEYDQGDQTGGMGAVAPATITLPYKKNIEEEQVQKAITGMFTEHIPYVGILYVGGMIVDGKPITIEYNARWGDPECQVVLPGVTTDYYALVNACIDGKLEEQTITEDTKTRISIVATARGYPHDFSSVQGKKVYGLDEAIADTNVLIFGSGLALQEKNWVVSGGRIFNIVAEGNDLFEAREKAYEAMARINVEGNNLHYRTDIGWRDVDRVLQKK
jgi:phosphoribosylamine---glycine ligase